MNIAEKYKIVPVMNNISLATTVYTDSINMKNYHDATFLIQLETLGTASSVLTVQSGTADSTYSSALYFNYAFGTAATAAATCDVLAATTNANTLTLTYGTYSDFPLVVHVEATDMDLANNEEWLALKFTDPGSATGTATVFAILTPRYKGNVSGTALA